jgi:hypothetical protein
MRRVTAKRLRAHNGYHFAVLEWSEDETESWVVSTHTNWDRALEAAFEYAQANGRDFKTAEIVTLYRHKEVLF